MPIDGPRNRKRYNSSLNAWAPSLAWSSLTTSHSEEAPCVHLDQSAKLGTTGIAILLGHLCAMKSPTSRPTPKETARATTARTLRSVARAGDSQIPGGLGAGMGAWTGIGTGAGT